MAKKSAQNEEKMPSVNPTGIINAPIIEEMQSAYLDYAMSVIVQRALPDECLTCSIPINKDAKRNASGRNSDPAISEMQDCFQLHKKQLR